MRARRYKHEDFDTILSWLDARGKKRTKRAYLPKRGWIVDGVACVFLIKSDCKMGIVDVFVTNPAVALDVRLKAADLLIADLEKEAIRIGLEAITGNTKILKVAALGMRYGFTYDPTPYFNFHKTLGEKSDERRNISRIDGGECLDADSSSAD